jgi:hypothetical protein
MPGHFRLVKVTAATSIVLAAASVSAQSGRVARTFPASPVKPIEIRVASGSVEIRGEDRADISVGVERSAGVLSSEVVAEREERIIVDVRPGTGANVEAPVKVTVLAPRATPIQFVHVADGDVSLSRWRGSVQVKVERGAIVAEDVAGIVRLETGSGDITVRQAVLPRDGLLRCRTLTGHVDIDFAQIPADARILLMTMSGTVTTDLPVTDKEEFGGRLKEGKLGNGQPLLSIDAVRGNLTVTVAR